MPGSGGMPGDGCSGYRQVVRCSRHVKCAGGGVVNRREIGELGERIAAAFLSLKGYSILKKNHWFARREIDLLARKGSVLVAVEVRLRRGDRFGTAIQSVDERKVARVRFALEGVLSSFPKGLQPRIDLVVIDVSSDLNRMDVLHVEGIH